MKLSGLILRIAEKYALPSMDKLETCLDDFVSNTLLKNETLQKAFGISGFELEEVYAEAFDLYQDDAFIYASASFRWLVLLNPFVIKYWMGLAASLQMLEKYEKALHAYAVAALQDCHNPYPHFHAYECYIQLENKEDAEKALELAFQRTTGKAAYLDLQNEIKRLKAYPVLS